jgi:hypothetical protein
MPKLRKLNWNVIEWPVEPSDYGFESDTEILAMVRKKPCPTDLNAHIDLCQCKAKQFTRLHLQQLVAARGFLNVVCNWVEPDQIADAEVRTRVALIQHLLSEVWERLE